MKKKMNRLAKNFPNARLMPDPECKNLKPPPMLKINPPTDWSKNYDAKSGIGFCHSLKIDRDMAFQRQKKTEKTPIYPTLYRSKGAWRREAACGGHPPPRAFWPPSVPPVAAAPGPESLWFSAAGDFYRASILNFPPNFRFCDSSENSVGCYNVSFYPNSPGFWHEIALYTTFVAIDL